jgi:hypothetical protein
MAKRIKAKIGDVLKINIKEGYFSCGYYLYDGRHGCYMVFFKELYKADDIVECDKIIKGERIIIGNTFDKHIKLGDWEVLGNITPNLKDYPFPVYKYGSEFTEFMLVSYDGTKRRKATEMEFLFYEYGSRLSEPAIEDAIMGVLGIVPWNKHYNNILYKNVLERSKPIKWQSEFVFSNLLEQLLRYFKP